MPATVRLVVTAGPTVGRGHLARALSLAEAPWPPGTRLELELLADTLSEGERARAEAVGLRQVPADATLAPSTVVVVDVPDPSSVAVRFDPAGLAVFDDQETFDGAAALVIQPSLGQWGGSAKAGAVLAGFDYVPVSAAVRRLRSSAVARSGPRDRARVLVCFGGSDPAQVTARLAPALASLVGPDTHVEIVVGPSYRGATDGWPVVPRIDPPDLVERLAAADVALLGAGTMKFEAACLWRPTLLLAVADDQLPVGPAFAATGAARYLGDGRTLDPFTVVAEISGLLAHHTARARMGKTAGQVVDGDGANRIASAVARLDQPTGRS